MRKIAREELIPYTEYQKVADRFLKKVIEVKKLQRIIINDRMSGVFENRLTVWYQIMEMIRAERITEEEYIQELLQVYNDLIPEDHELSMTFFIEIPNQEKLREFNKTVIGIENHVQLLFGSETVTSYEPEDELGDGEEDYTQSVHYLRFPFTPEQKQAFLTHAGEVTLKVAHPNFQSDIQLSQALVKELQLLLQGKNDTI